MTRFLSMKAPQRRVLIVIPTLLVLAVGMLAMNALGYGPKAYAAGTSSTCDQYGTIDIAGKNYVVQNDLWNPHGGAQCISADTSSGNFTVTTANNSLPTNGPPASYASIFQGCHWGNCTNNSGMPIQASAIGSANSTWNINTVGGNWDSSYDIWFNQTPTTSGQPNGAEVMVWVNHSGPPQPIGSQVATVTINGASWAVWVGNIGWNVISYVRTSGATSVNFDLNNFFHDAEARGQVANNWYLIAVEAGFELWDGGAGMGSSGFSVDINGGGGSGSLAGRYKLKDYNSGKLMAVTNMSQADGAQITQWDDNGTADHLWNLVDVGNGYYTIVNSNSGKVLTPLGWSTADGASLVQWDNNGTNDHLWKFIDNGNGYYRILNYNSNKVATPSGWSTADGAPIIQWDDNGTVDHLWQLIPA